ncbi:MAG TPA: SpoIIE family protein phosphatase [Acidimicrobiales bacterium]|nr:SpoIIE family protein phosphatase [Acidimicrobiales bacterium]
MAIRDSGSRAGSPTDASDDDAPERELDQLFLLHATALQAGAAVSRWWLQLRADVQDATTERSLDDVLRNSLHGIAEALGADAVALLLAEPSGELTVRAAVGMQPELWRQVSIASGTGMAGKVVAERRPMVVPDLSAIEVVSTTLRDSGMRSLVAVPVTAGDEVIGVVHADSVELDHFDQRDAGLLQVVADRLAAAIERVKLFEAERSARERAEAVADRLGRLQRITAALSGDVSAAQVAGIVQSELAPELGGDVTSLGVWLLQGNRLCLLREWDADPDVRLYGDMDLDEARPAPQAVQAGTALWLGSRAEVEAAFASPDQAPLEAQAVAVLPLAVEGRALGVLALGFGREREFATEERIFLWVVAQQAAEALHRADLREARARAAAEHAFLADVSAALGASLDPGEILRGSVRLMVPQLADMVSVHLFDELGVLRRVAMSHRDPEREADFVANGQDSEYESRSVLATLAAAQGRPVLLSADAFAPPAGAALDAAHEELLADLDIGSAIAVPLTARGEDLGLLGLLRVSSSPALTENELELAAEIGLRTSHAIDNALQHQRRIEVARALQASLLPPALSPVPGAEVAAVFHPATAGVDVGGDFYDLFPVEDGRWVLMIGDVSGSGPAAAALTAQVRHGARVAARAGLEPAAVVAAVNATLDETTGSEWFCTMVYAELVPHEAGIDLQVICAGHIPPLVMRAGHVEEVDCQGPLLGVLPSAAFSAKRLRLGPGHALVLVTDGATEARPRGRHGLDSFFGEERLRQALASVSEGDAKSLVEAVAWSVLEFTGGQLGDDLALVALRATPDQNFAQ